MPGDVCVMLLVMPPATVTDAVSPVALNVWTCDSAASSRVQPAGFLSGTTETQWECLRLAWGSVSMLAVSMLVASTNQR